MTFGADFYIWLVLSWLRLCPYFCKCRCLKFNRILIFFKNLFDLLYGFMEIVPRGTVVPYPMYKSLSQVAFMLHGKHCIISQYHTCIRRFSVPCSFYLSLSLKLYVHIYEGYTVIPWGLNGEVKTWVQDV